ncbi:MAG: tetratricopeptide repeat protein [Candidatus Korobacteraceae bacterium]
MPNGRCNRPRLLSIAAIFVLLVISSSYLSGQVNSLGATSSSFEDLAHQAAAAREQGKPQEAVGFYQQALQIHPEWEEGWWYVGTLLYDGNHFAEALPAFSKVVELDPRMGPAWSFLGLCDYETKDYSSALTHLEKGHELGTEQVPEIGRVADYHLALLLIRKGEFERATTLLSSQFVRGQVAEQVKVALGMAFLQVPLLPDEVDPSKDAVIATAGSIAVLLAQHQQAEALSACQQAVRDYPTIPNLHAACAAIAHPATATSQRPDANALAGTARLFARSTAETKSGNAAPDATSSSAGFDQLARKAVAARDAGRLDDAIRDYQQALQLRPSWEDGWWDLSLVYFSNNRYADAIPTLKHVVGLKPGFGTAWAMLGLSEYETKDYKNALIHLEKAQGLGIQGSPEAIRIAQYHLAALLNQNGEFERSVELLSAGHPEGELVTQWNIALGMGLLRVPRLPEQVEPAQQPMYLAAGQAASLLANSKYDDAFVVLQKLLKDYPNVPFIHYAYGAALASLSQYDEAETQLREEIRISPASALPYIRIAFIDLKTHRSADALAAAQRATQLAPQSPEAHYVLGRALLGTGETEQAIKELQSANEMMPNSPEIHFHLARAYSKGKQPEKADQERETFARLNALAEHQRSTHGSQAYGASHEQESDLSLPPVAAATEAAPPR